MDKLNLNVINIFSITVLATLLAIAIYTDLRSRRISNQLVLIGSLIGIVLHAFLPKGQGLFDSIPGGTGYLTALFGFGVGLVLLMPLYLFRALGAGDVKLMAMAGAFLGPASVMGAVLLTFLAGGLLAITAALWQKALRKTLMNVRFMLVNTLIDTLSGKTAKIEGTTCLTGKLPYAIAIAVGTSLQVILIRTGHPLFP